MAGATWQTDIDAAQAYAEQLVDQVSAAKGWNGGWIAAAEAYITQARRDVSFWSTGADAAAEFWTLLYAGWCQITEKQGAPLSWDKLCATWRNAAQAGASAAEAESAANPLNVAAGTLGGSLEDAGDVVIAAGQAGGKVVEAAKSPWAWIGAAAAAIAIALAARSRR